MILDTNVLLSALIRVDSNPYKLVQAWLGGRFEPSPIQLQEISRVARYPDVRRFMEPADVGWLINRMRERALIVERLPDVDVSADPGDNFLIAMAQAGNVDYLVTGDKAGVLAIGKHGKTQIVAVNKMVTTLKLMMRNLV